MPQLWGIDTRRQVNNTPQGESESGGSSHPSNIGSSNIIPKSGGIESLGDAGDMNPAQAAQANARGKPKKWNPKDWEDAIRQLFERLNKGLDFNDPRTQSILMNVRNTTMQGQNDRGIYGGYSEGQAEGSYIKAAAGLQDAQDARALQALGMGSGFSARMAEDQYQADMNKYMMDKESGGDWGSTIGGGLGAIGGGILGIPGGPAGIVAGAGAGWQLGSGIGGKIGGAVSGGSSPKWGGY